MIDPNKKYRTRNGREVRIYATDGNRMYPIHGAVKYDDGWVGHVWTEEGKYHSPDIDHFRDLVDVPTKHTRWLNINRDSAGDVWPHPGFYATKGSADHFASACRVACIEVTFHEGEGL